MQVVQDLELIQPHHEQIHPMERRDIPNYGTTEERSDLVREGLARANAGQRTLLEMVSSMLASPQRSTGVPTNKRK